MDMYLGCGSNSLGENMKLCIAFDRDNTVETGNPPGPIPISLVRSLAQKHVVVAIGAQQLCQEAGIESGALGASKQEHLKLLKEKYKCDRYIVVDDSPIIVEGWEYYSPHEFLRKLQEGRI